MLASNATPYWHATTAAHMPSASHVSFLAQWPPFVHGWPASGNASHLSSAPQMDPGPHEPCAHACPTPGPSPQVFLAPSQIPPPMQPNGVWSFAAASGMQDSPWIGTVAHLPALQRASKLLHCAWRSQGSPRLRIRTHTALEPAGNGEAVVSHTIPDKQSPNAPKFSPGPSVVQGSPAFLSGEQTDAWGEPLPVFTHASPEWQRSRWRPPRRLGP